MGTSWAVNGELARPDVVSVNADKPLEQLECPPLTNNVVKLLIAILKQS